MIGAASGSTSRAKAPPTYEEMADQLLGTFEATYRDVDVFDFDGKK